LDRVRFRILQNRARLEQEQLQQVEKTEAEDFFQPDQSRWAQEEPAVTVYDENPGLVIWYPNTGAPRVTTRGLSVVGLPGFSDELGEGMFYEVVSFRGQNALTNSGTFFSTPPTWELDLSSTGAEFLTGAFTVEWFQRVQPFDFYSPIVNMLLSVGSDSTFAVLSDNGSAGADDPPIIVRPTVNDVIVEDDWYFSNDVSVFAHVSIQRISGNRVTLHYGGTKIYESSVGSIGDKLNLLAFQTLNSNAGKTAISQIRVSNSAIYGDGTFSPPTGVFFRG
jgi:hypothetical protein